MYLYLELLVLDLTLDLGLMAFISPHRPVSISSVPAELGV